MDGDSTVHVELRAINLGCSITQTIPAIPSPPSDEKDRVNLFMREKVFDTWMPVEDSNFSAGHFENGITFKIDRSSLEESAEPVQRRFPHFLVPLVLFDGFQTDVIETHARPSELPIKADEDKARWAIRGDLSLPGKKQLTPSQHHVRADDVDF